MSKNDREADHGSGRLPHLLRIDELAQRLGGTPPAPPGTRAADPIVEVGHFVMLDERKSPPGSTSARRKDTNGRRSSWDGKSLAVPLV